jgi:hypothetical protein
METYKLPFDHLEPNNQALKTSVFKNTILLFLCCGSCKFTPTPYVVHILNPL